MKNVQTRMVLVKSIIGGAYDIDELNEVLTEYADEHGEHAMKELRILNVTHEVPRVSVFPLQYKEGELLFDDESWRSSSGVYILHDYNDREFEDTDELREFIRGEIENGMMDITEAQNVDITYLEKTPVEMNIEQEKGEWRLDVGNFEAKHREAMDAMAIEYVPVYEAEKVIKQLNAEIAEAKASSEVHLTAPMDMNDGAIDLEIEKLEARLSALYREQRVRKAQGAEV